MIGLHREVRLALRTRLRTLSVLTTGSTTLAATSTGYTRSAGSFLDDGFAVGMEVTPSGFPQTTTGVIESLSALALTIKGGRTVAAAAAGRSLSVGLPSTQGWDNRHAQTTTGVPFVIEQYIPGPSRRISGYGPGTVIEMNPMYAPQVHVPAGVGVGAADAYIDAILELFAPGTTIALQNPEDVLRVRGDVGPSAGQLLQSTAGHAVIPVTIPLLIRTTVNAA